MRRIDDIIIHCSATRVNTDYTVYQLMKDHKARGFKPPFGYQFYIPKEGAVVMGRPIEQIGAHVKGYNTHSIGICYEGGLNAQAKAADTRTVIQKAAILQTISQLLQDLKKFQEVGHIKIKGHRDYSPDLNHDGEITPDEWMKQCPCFNAPQEYKDVVTNFINRYGEYKPTGTVTA